MHQPTSSPETSRDIFQRLADRKISYDIVKKIVTFEIPQSAYFFVRQFDRRSIGEVLRHIERWRKFLGADFFLSGPERTDVIRTINGILLLTQNALLQANSPQIGDWEMQYQWLPSGTDDTGGPVYIWPAMKITARNRKVGQTLSALIPQPRFDGSRLMENSLQKAFEELGLWEQVEKGSLRSDLVSSRKPQGWPIYTQVVIPRLYEHLIWYYPAPGHHSEQRDASLTNRKALFPSELLEDMLEILRMEHPDAFEKTTINQLKANIQRHLARKTQSINSPLSPNSPANSTFVTSPS